MTTAGVMTTGTTGQTDLERFQAAVAEKEAKRERAIEKLAREAGETRWVLSKLDLRDREGGRKGGGINLNGAVLNFGRAGYADIDDTGTMGSKRVEGRMVFGKGWQKDLIDRGEDQGWKQVSLVFFVSLMGGS